MNWKEVVKPTKGKIIVTILLGVILLVSFLFNQRICDFVGPCPEPPKIATLLFNILAFPIFILLQTTLQGNDVLAIVSIVLTPFYLYLISSGIVILYHKTRKR
tara:strand:- start:49 stop:357 length:309 start_codon:yes stop_codon:yes gene_type:complete